MQPQIWMTGDAVIDLIPDGEQHYQKCPGGAPANVAVAVSRLGGAVGFFGRVGDDPLGRFMKQFLESENVNTEYLSLDAEHRTSTVLVDLDDRGERTFTFMVKPSADQYAAVNDIPQFLPGQWLHVCSTALANEPSRFTTLVAIEKIKAEGGYVSFDPNLRHEVWANKAEIRPIVLEAIALADVVKFSEEELAFLSGESSLEAGLEWIEAHYNLPVVVITLGKKGAVVVLEDSSRLIFPTTTVGVIDTTGAGDAFVGGMLAGLITTENWQTPGTIEKAMRQANGCGALAVTAKGAMTALPTVEMLDRFLGSSI